jgi:hypothetical protein
MTHQGAKTNMTICLFMADIRACHSRAFGCSPAPRAYSSQWIRCMHCAISPATHVQVMCSSMSIYCVACSFPFMSDRPSKHWPLRPTARNLKVKEMGSVEKRSSSAFSSSRFSRCLTPYFEHGDRCTRSRYHPRPCVTPHWYPPCG